MAYKFQEGDANLDGEISGSSFRTAGSLSGSGDLAVTGNMHAANYYGDGSNLTNISAELIDVTGSSENAAFKLAFVENLGTGVDLAGNVGLNYNPSTALLSSSAGAQFGGNSVIGGTLNVSGAATLTSLDVSAGGISNAGAIGGASTGQFTDVLTCVDVQSSGLISGSGGAQFVGNTFLGAALNVTGVASLDGGIDVNGSNFTVATDGDVSAAAIVMGGALSGVTTLDASGLASLDGGINVNDAYTVSTAGAVVANEFKTDGNEFVVSAAGLVTTTGITNAGAVLSSSHAAEIVGNSRLVGNVGVTGAISLDTNGGGINFDSGTNTMKITNNGGGTMGLAAPSAIHFSTFMSGGAELQIVGATILGSTLGLTGAADFESTLEVQSGVYNHGYRRYEMSTITANTELTASSSKSYQMVSGGTSVLTVILPSASAGQYYQYGIKRHSLMSGNVILEGNGAELIDGETNVTLSSVNASVYLISDGTQWNIF
jgi:hypothetical protein